MTKLLHIPNYYYPHTGGTEQVCRDIVHSLADRNFEQKIICFNGDAERGDLRCSMKDTTIDFVDGIEVRRCGCITKISSQSISLTYPKELKSLIDEFDPDIIIFHYPNPYVASFLIPMIKKEVKFILYWHLDIIKQKFLKHFFIGQTITLLKRANVIVATSPDYIEESEFLFEYKYKCTVIPNCVSSDFEKISDYSLNKANEIREKYNDKCICFTVGRHIPYKGYEFLIEAAKYLDDDYIILIGGKGPLTDSLKKKASGLTNVELLGFVSDDDLVSYYLACDIISFSSVTKNEAFGLSLAEGMSFGKPAVTFTIPGSGVNYVNLNGVTGLEAPNRDSRAFASNIEKIYKNRELYLRFSLEAKERVKKLFSFSTFKNNINQLIEEISK